MVPMLDRRSHPSATLAAHGAQAAKGITFAGFSGLLTWGFLLAQAHPDACSFGDRCILGMVLFFWVSYWVLQELPFLFEERSEERGVD